MVNTVPSLGSVGGAALAAHQDVDKVAFTGSTVTGRKIMEAAAKSNLKKVSSGSIGLAFRGTPMPDLSFLFISHYVVHGPGELGKEGEAL